MQRVETQLTPISQSDRAKNSLRSLISAPEFGILLFLVITVLGLALARDSFLTRFNVLNMGRQMAQLAEMGVALTFLITAQELDFSVGSTFGLCSLGMALLVQHYGSDLWLAFAISLALGAVIGFVNGAITTYGRIPSF